jgi:ribulose-phosphate 3-epimerase
MPGASSGRAGISLVACKTARGKYLKMEVWPDRLLHRECRGESSGTTMNRQACLERLQAAAPAVLPSLLQCDFGNLEREVRNLEAAGVSALHLDVMDGNFVPNLTYGMPIVAAIRRLTDLPLDVHLMIREPQAYVRQFREAGADTLTFHIEAVPEPRDLLAEIRSLGAGSGIALNPSTPLASIAECLDLCDLVLVMSVHAGFGGQTFHENALERLRWVREQAGPGVLLEVDGGVNENTISRCAAAGAQLFVVGSAIFGRPRYDAAVRELTALAASPT